MIKNVAVLALDGVEPFGLGTLCEVWAEESHEGEDTPRFDFAVCGERPGRVAGASGFDVHVEHGLDRLAEADLVAIAPRRNYTRPISAEVSDALRAAHERGAIITASCTAVFTLGQVGLLKGRRCTTHWRHAELLAESFPEATVDADVLYVDDDGILTGAGSAAGIDASLYLVRKEFGARVALTFARRMVVPPHRDGGQAQFIRSPIAETSADTLEPVLSWARDHLQDPLPVETLAEKALMSPRTFARRFRDETGTTPHQWVTQQRLALAEQLLEDTMLGIDEVARDCGFGNAATLRHHFNTARGTSPQEYRRRFGCARVG